MNTYSNNDWRYYEGGELYHYGILGQKWGVRRYQNPDGSLTEAHQHKFLEGVFKMANNDWRDYEPRNDALAHSWGTSPKQKAKEKAYNHEYWENNKDRILRKRQLHKVGDVYTKEARKITDEEGFGPLASTYVIGRTKVNEFNQLHDDSDYIGKTGRHLSRTLGARDEEERLLSEKRSAERAAAPAKQGLNSNGSETDSGTHANLSINHVSRASIETGKAAIDRIIKLQNAKR